MEDCSVLANAVTRHALIAYEAQQLPRAKAFLAAEKTLVNILVDADEEQYQNFVHEIQFPDPAKSSLLELLKNSGNALGRNNCCETIN